MGKNPGSEFKTGTSGRAKTFIDYAGKTIPVINPSTGEFTEAEIFVTVLGASNYTYAEADESSKTRYEKNVWFSERKNAANRLISHTWQSAESEIQSQILLKRHGSPSSFLSAVLSVHLLLLSIVIT